MSSTRYEARRRGVRMAAQIAMVSGLVAAGAAYGDVAESAPAVRDGGGQANAGGPSAEEGQNPADQVTESLRVRAVKGNCGCAPCWGPPAPPPMRDDLYDLFLEARA